MTAKGDKNQTSMCLKPHENSRNGTTRCGRRPGVKSEASLDEEESLEILALGKNGLTQGKR